jgi:hypothetical protein
MLQSEKGNSMNTNCDFEIEPNLQQFALPGNGYFSCRKCILYPGFQVYRHEIVTWSEAHRFALD